MDCPAVKVQWVDKQVQMNNHVLNPPAEYTRNSVMVLKYTKKRSSLSITKLAFEKIILYKFKIYNIHVLCCLCLTFSARKWLSRTRIEIG